MLDAATVRQTWDLLIRCAAIRRVTGSGPAQGAPAPESGHPIVTAAG